MKNHKKTTSDNEEYTTVKSAKMTPATMEFPYDD